MEHGFAGLLEDQRLVGRDVVAGVLEGNGQLAWQVCAVGPALGMPQPPAQHRFLHPAGQVDESAPYPGQC